MFLELFFWLSSSKLKLVWVKGKGYFHALSLLFYDPIVLVLFV